MYMLDWKNIQTYLGMRSNRCSYPQSSNNNELLFLRGDSTTCCFMGVRTFLFNMNMHVNLTCSKDWPVSATKHNNDQNIKTSAFDLILFFISLLSDLLYMTEGSVQEDERLQDRTVLD